ncbi:serine/threonine protein kinase [Lentzea tibetensis]|uniref:Serine/threonine protein kinase n=1 Tax=Lentzea tibetensis TaxID=2591470 RepID=A0A563EVL3_9PSEU|nr:class IV lanthionine synthetase LanL [Lentzea tibetensis]TWP51757.1 serine/threonine protein kinase [Lentzea tibetensis]
MAGHDDSRLLIDIVTAVLARAGADWTIDTGAFWCSLSPPDGRMPDQGWKLHVSATQLSAPVVLSRAADVLIAEGCAFKFARGLDEVAALLSSRCDRGSGGKFITAYPLDDETFRRVAARLDLATDGLPGPAILSDRRLRPNSLVHYRYGVFGAEAVLTNDGGLEPVLTGPDGEKIVDERPAWFSPPEWAVAPLPEPSGADGGRVPESVLIADRFVVREAVRHSYRGGVYRATDRDTGDEVIVKQARPHVMGLLTGMDARDVLRHEAEMLDLLSPLGLAPRKIALVRQQDNLFLAEELVPGVTLRRWVAERCIDVWRGAGAPVAEAVDKAGRLVGIVTAVHRQDLVLRDFTPNNVMVTPDERLRLIDPELIVATGSRASAAHTAAYGAPEQVSAPRFGPVPSQRADLYSLGATIMFLVSGVDPLLPADERPLQARIAEFVTALGTSMPAVRAFAPLILGLLRDAPEERWTTAQAHAFLADERHAEAVAPARLRAATVDRVLADGLNHALRTMSPTNPRLWPVDEQRGNTDPANVQHGVAGVLGVLTRAARVLGDDHLREGVATAAGWLDRRLFDVPRLLPGLYFGRAGTAWAMYDAARLLGDDEMAARAVELAKRLPVRWPNPDVCHGTAGAGMAYLRLWLATGDSELERRVEDAADCVLDAAQERDGHLTWPIPATFDSRLSGLAHYGFAHGVAGVGAFLLYCGVSTGRADCVTAARQAGNTLAAAADLDHGAAWWPSGTQRDPAASRMWHWCSGSSGVGTFLIRLWSVTGEPRFRDLAEAGAVAIRRAGWYSSTAACHGLAGDGEFLLDLAACTGDHRYHEWASELAAIAHTRHAIRDGLAVLPDESGADTVAVGYSTGLSGVLGFLLRLRHGGQRWWMPDEILAPEGKWPVFVARTPELTVH